MKLRLRPFTALTGLGLLLPLQAGAALPPAAPDSGRLTRELRAPIEAPREDATIALPVPGKDRVAPGGIMITPRAVSFTGNTVYSQEVLAALVRPHLGKPRDLAGLYELADLVSEFYRQRGYSFAKAYIPSAGFRDGVLTIDVVEGRYGEIRVQADSPARSEQAGAFLQGLSSGDVIRAPELERRLLILDDQPGYDVMPVMQPGKAVGRGDLDVRLSRSVPLGGGVSLSNTGNRYTGYYQLNANTVLGSPFLFGDQLSLSAMQSDERLHAVNAGYSLPLGGSGLRATMGYGLTSYRLTREFESLQASGTAQTSSLGLRYPLLRSRNVNVSVSLSGQHKRFYDEQRAVGARQSRASDSGVLAVSFDRRDGSGVTYGQVEVASGSFDGVRPDPARVNGRFLRINADLARLQRIGTQGSLLARVSTQMAGDNLDSSEGFVLGGPNGVRAFPSGEAAGDEGAYAQLEFRYGLRYGLTPFVFYDIGRVRQEHDMTAAGKNTRTLSGAGVGLRYQYGPWNLETLMARRLTGGAPETDPHNEPVRFWLVFSYAF